MATTTLKQLATKVFGNPELYRSLREAVGSSKTLQSTLSSAGIELSANDLERLRKALNGRVFFRLPGNILVPGGIGPVTDDNGGNWEIFP
jgi:hypothetical protein